jgi:hypothetical protein
VLTRRWATFIVLGLAFFGFGVGTLNLFMLLKANADLLAAHGWVAVMDGGLRQLVELLVTGYASMLCYVVFKACEYSLVRHLADPPPAGKPASDATRSDSLSADVTPSVATRINSPPSDVKPADVPPSNAPRGPNA